MVNIPWCHDCNLPDGLCKCGEQAMTVSPARAASQTTAAGVAQAERAMDALEGLSDAWAAEVNLTAMIDNIVSPMGLNKSAPPEVRAEFTARMKTQIDAIVRQAYIEGAYRARIAGALTPKTGMPTRALTDLIKQQLYRWDMDENYSADDVARAILALQTGE